MGEKHLHKDLPQLEYRIIVLYGFRTNELLEYSRKGSQSSLFFFYYL